MYIFDISHEAFSIPMYFIRNQIPLNKPYFDPHCALGIYYIFGRCKALEQKKIDIVYTCTCIFCIMLSKKYHFDIN